MINIPRIVLFGSNGQVGWELQRSLSTIGLVSNIHREHADLSDPDQIIQVIRYHQPDLIVNAAAYTAVDKAEDEPDLAMAINGIAPAVMAEEAKKLNAAMVHYSTDYVYDGSGDTPWKETDPARPLSVYGKTKLEGDTAIQASGIPHLILRTSWVYGLHGNNFVKTMIKLGSERKELSVVCDQIGAPTSARVIADTTGQILAQAKGELASFLRKKGGVFHLSCAGRTSWHGFAQEIFRRAAELNMNLLTRDIKPVPGSEYPARANRPKNSLLDCTMLHTSFYLTPPTWEKAIGHFFSSIITDRLRD